MLVLLVLSKVSACRLAELAGNVPELTDKLTAIEPDTFRLLVAQALDITATRAEPDAEPTADEQTAIWEWFDNDFGRFRQFDLAAQAKLELAFGQKKNGVALSIHGKAYKVDLRDPENMSQINVATKFRRRVRRALQSGAPLPLLAAAGTQTRKCCECREPFLPQSVDQDKSGFGWQHPIESRYCRDCQERVHGMFMKRCSTMDLNSVLQLVAKHPVYLNKENGDSCTALQDVARYTRTKNYKQKIGVIFVLLYLGADPTLVGAEQLTFYQLLRKHDPVSISKVLQVCENGWSKNHVTLTTCVLSQKQFNGLTKAKKRFKYPNFYSSNHQQTKLRLHSFSAVLAEHTSWMDQATMCSSGEPPRCLRCTCLVQDYALALHMLGPGLRRMRFLPAQGSRRCTGCSRPCGTGAELWHCLECQPTLQSAEHASTICTSCRAAPASPALVFARQKLALAKCCSDQLVAMSPAACLDLDTVAAIGHTMSTRPMCARITNNHNFKPGLFLRKNEVVQLRRIKLFFETRESEKFGTTQHCVRQLDLIRSEMKFPSVPALIVKGCFELSEGLLQPVPGVETLVPL
eukprot:SAG31_NODE_635_length_13360_cov_4.229847_11_plen_576_part_00